MPELTAFDAVGGLLKASTGGIAVFGLGAVGVRRRLVRRERLETVHRGRRRRERENETGAAVGRVERVENGGGHLGEPQTTEEDQRRAEEARGRDVK